MASTKTRQQGKGVNTADVLDTFEIKLAELIQATAKKTGFDQSDSEMVIEAFLGICRENLQAGANLRLGGLGKILIKTVARRGEPSGKIIFYPATDLWKAVNDLPKRAVGQGVS
jgi:nucleoid DNA-binding protein